MNFIGVISDHKSFENINSHLKKEEIKLININKKSIGNIKNIKFETIIINSNLNNFKQEEYVIEQLCLNAKYLFINTDVNIKFSISPQSKVNIITYGLNQKATVTISSITETDILIYLQRNIKNAKGKVIEVGEKMININENNKLKTYEILMIYIIFLIYYDTIIRQL